MASPIAIFPLPGTQRALDIPAISAYADVITSADFTLSIRASRHRLETGAEIIDHAVATPYTLRVAGMVSDVQAWDGSKASPERMTAAFNALTTLVWNREPVKVVTQWASFQDMLITSLNVPQSVRSGRSLQFTMTLEQVRFVDTARGPLPDAGGELEDRGGRVDIGPVRPDPTDNPGDTDDADAGDPPVGGYTVPLTNEPSQRLDVSLPDGTSWRLDVDWNPSDDSWYISLRRPNGEGLQVGTRMVANTRLVTSVPAFPGNLIAAGPGTTPGRQAWTTTHQLRWSPNW